MNETTHPGLEIGHVSILMQVLMLVGYIGLGLIVVGLAMWQPWRGHDNKEERR